MRKSAAPKFAKESDLCRAFIDDVERQYSGRWVPYAETGGFDLLLVRKADGLQLGIEAKLKLNPKVVSQALRYWRYAETGPDYRAVLVPVTDLGDMGDICRALGIGVMRQHHPAAGRWASYLSLPDPAYSHSEWMPWYPMNRITLPDYIPDVTAGSSAPMTLSSWKIAAIKAQILLEERPLSRADIKALGLSPSRWFDRYTGFLKPIDNGYVASSYMPDFARQHPTNYEQIKADKGKWMASLLKTLELASP